VLVHVVVDARVVPAEEPEPDGLDLVDVAGQELPARQLGAVHLREGVERLGAVLLRLDGDRVHEGVVADATLEPLLNPLQVRGHGGADALAVGVHHVDDGDLAAHQVVVEAELPALGVGQ
jgi:hypothetical protein